MKAGRENQREEITEWGGKRSCCSWQREQHKHRVAKTSGNCFLGFLKDYTLMTSGSLPYCWILWWLYIITHVIQHKSGGLIRKMCRMKIMLGGNFKVLLHVCMASFWLGHSSAANGRLFSTHPIVPSFHVSPLVLTLLWSSLCSRSHAMYAIFQGPRWQHCIPSGLCLCERKMGGQSCIIRHLSNFGHLSVRLRASEGRVAPSGRDGCRAL